MVTEDVDPEEFRKMEEDEKASHIRTWVYLWAACGYCRLKFPVRVRLDEEAYVVVCPRCERDEGIAIDFSQRIPGELFEVWKLPDELTPEYRQQLMEIGRRQDAFWDRA